MSQPKLFGEVEKRALISCCAEYRYTLWRIWGDETNYVNFIGLNPSTADAYDDDPTIRRCIDFAQQWGFGALAMTNLFAYRSPHPRVMMKHPSPVGAQNDEWLVEVAGKAKLVIAAWGKDGVFQDRAVTVLRLINREVYALKISGHTRQPYHPLYLPKDSKPILYEGGK